MNMPGAGVLLQSDTNELEIVEFRIDETTGSGSIRPCYYGVNVAKVREIIRVPHLWGVFSGNPAIAGMIKLRDKVITVIDIATVFAKNCQTLTPDRIIVLEFNNITVGFLVHAVSRIHRISWEQVEPPARTVESTQINGLVKMEDRLILLIDFEKIIGDLSNEHAMRNADEQLIDATASAAASIPGRILVADDSPFIRNMITSTLRSAGFQVDEAENGEEAWQLVTGKIERCRTTGEQLSKELALVITDVEMPRMDGLHLTSLIRREEVLKGLPVIIFSSMASEDNKRKWRDIGADDILTKPDMPRLVEIVAKLACH